MQVGEMQAKPPKILLWGDIGTGKTALALTLGEGALCYDLDDGVMTGATLKDKWYDDRRKVEVRQFIEKEPHKKAIAFNQVKQSIISLANEFNAKTAKWTAVILDSISTLADMAVAQIMSNSGTPNAAPQIQHWGLAFSEIQQVLAMLRILPVPVVMIGHEQTKTIGSGLDADTKLELAINGKNMPSKIMRYCDEIWYMKVKAAAGGKVTYNILTNANPTVPARSRGQIPNNTDTACGMWELIRLSGYTKPEVKK